MAKKSTTGSKVSLIAKANNTGVTPEESETLKETPNETPKEDEEYDEDEDEDYDPSKKVAEEEPESEGSDHEQEPDYSAINTGYSQIKTRTQRYQENLEGKTGLKQNNGIITESTLNVDVDAIFNALRSGEKDEWASLVNKDAPKEEEKPAPKPANESLGIKQVRIETSYTFAGKLVRETKLVDEDSAEAKAYLSSTSGVVQSAGENGRKSFVTVIRELPGTSESVPLRIKLKRSSLIDKFLASSGDKKNKLTTLEKSRLDWASFVDKRSIKDDLALHNKAGYLDKQDFLGRVDANRDENYQKAKELERQRQWQLQQKTG